MHVSLQRLQRGARPERAQHGRPPPFLPFDQECGAATNPVARWTQVRPPSTLRLGTIVVRRKVALMLAVRASPNLPQYLRRVCAKPLAGCCCWNIKGLLYEEYKYLGHLKDREGEYRWPEELLKPFVPYGGAFTFRQRALNPPLMGHLGIRKWAPKGYPDQTDMSGRYIPAMDSGEARKTSEGTPCTFTKMMIPYGGSSRIE